MRLILALLLSGCIASVTAEPLSPAYCLSRVAPHPACDAEYIWMPGYWTRDGWGQKVWVPGKYIPRHYPRVRDHRR